MAKRRTVKQMADAAENRLRLERARLESDLVKLHRKQLRTALATHSAAKSTRLDRDWRPRPSSADSATLSDSPMLMARARQMLRDDPVAKAGLHAFKRNVVGSMILPKPVAKGPDGELLRQFNLDNARAFRAWAKTRQVDIENRLNLRGMERWCVNEMVSVGGCLVVHSIHPTKGYVLQRVEYEQLDTTRMRGEGDNDVRAGVEVDEFGAPVAYWVYRRHPNDVVGLNRPAPLSLESVRIEAWRVSHVYDSERARQTRGVTWMAPSLRKMRDFGSYDEAQLVAAKAEACQGVLIKTNRAQNNPPVGLSESAAGTANSSTEQNDELDMQPLMVARLLPEEDVVGFTPTRPGTMYEPYSVRQMRLIAASMDISYEQLTMDFSKGNFSSQKKTEQEDRKGYESWQRMIYESLLMDVWRHWLTVQMITGRVATPGGFGFTEDHDLYDTEFIPAEWEPADLKDHAEGVTAMVQAGLTSVEDEAAKLGRLPQEHDDATIDSTDDGPVDQQPAGEPAGEPGVQPS